MAGETNGGHPADKKEVSVGNVNKSVRKFKFLSLIGSGSFGQIYSGIDTTCGQKVAIKVQSESSSHHNQLQIEYHIYKHYLSQVKGFPSVSHFARTKKHQYFVMSLLGMNLEELFDQCGRKFTLKTQLMLAIQLIERLKSLHDHSGHLHRDIKPENILMGRGQPEEERIIYLVDLGLAKRFLDPVTKEHIQAKPMARNKSLTGTARYASVNAHCGRDQSRRDDLEAAAYVIIYLAKGKLPWQGIKTSSKKQRYEKICQLKMAIPTHELVEGTLEEYGLLLEYVKKLRFDEQPDYDLLSGMLLEVMLRHKLINDGHFDWME